MEVNGNVVNGFNAFDVSPGQSGIAPKYAESACLSEAQLALWTNRVPQHEPWPRVMKVDETINKKTDEIEKNVRHIDQFDNTSNPDGLKPIGKVEGTEEISRGKFWRR